MSDLTADERAQVENLLKPHARGLLRADVEIEEIPGFLVRKYKVNPELAAVAAREVAEDGVRILELRDPITIANAKTTWYTGPKHTTGVWPDLKSLLQSSGKWTDDDIASLDATSTRILASLPAPGRPHFKSKGLVVGYVQSGKTASYTALISKAADEGYKLFIVVAGLTDRLRTQTQRRLTRELTSINPHRWHTMTSDKWDFSAQHQTMQAAAMLASNNDQRVLAVVKKNTSRLDRLCKWLRTAAPQLKDAPVLIIDDEADEASINTARQAQARTAINSRLVGLIATLPKVAYVAYTATPFANLLIPADDPASGPVDDLYPSSFITELPRPAAYIGAERIFGRATLPTDSEESASIAGLDVVREIPIDDEAALRVPSSAARFTFSPPPVPSLRSALQWFVLSCAMRRARGQENEHMTMLVHTSQYTAVHESTRATMRLLLDGELNALSTQKQEYFSTLERLWTDEHDRVRDDSIAGPLTWTAVQDQIPSALKSLRIFVENGFAQEVDFDKEIVQGIVIGGNVLSRGLTIEGLAVSYFIRTASAYDTLLQMGRWFGFRNGYLDVSRIWMPATLQRDFSELALVEEEIRTDIRRYAREAISPTEFAVRIRCHSTLLVTSKLKSRRAVRVKIGFAGREISTRVFYRLDSDWLARAWNSGAELLQRIEASGKRAEDVRKSAVYRDVEAEKVLDFLDQYAVHPDCGEFNKKIVADYIRNAIHTQAGRLSKWNVAIIQPERGSMGTHTAQFGGREVALLNRSRIDDKGVQGNYANIRALTSEGDAGIDLPSSDPRVQQADRAGLLSIRTELLPDRGLLLLYPIDKSSQAPKNSNTRTALEAAAHVLAAAIVFPGQQPKAGFLENDYISADLSAIEQLEPEEEDFQETEDGILVASQ